MGHRARAFASRLNKLGLEIAYRSQRKTISVFGLLFFLVRRRPWVVYVFDISYSGVLSACSYRFVFGGRLIIETGDAIVELVRSTGSRSRFGLILTQMLEAIAFYFADQIVVRGSFHREWLRKRGIEAEVIHDGVDMDSFAPIDSRELREQHKLDGFLTVGLIGSSVWSDKLQMCYGWELVEVIRLLKNKPVKGVMIGGGSGITHLKSRCREYGIEDRIFFPGHVPFEQLNSHLNMIDVCLSTQTNDIVGQVRTTGKLPLYLAAGRWVLASSVGEASLVLPNEMLIEYAGVKDESYPQKLACRIEGMCDQQNVPGTAQFSVEIARKNFSYSMLAERVREVISSQTTRRLQRTKPDVVYVNH
jgi:glycosyltransferase involved in cell wall biosynthesis